RVAIPIDRWAGTTRVAVIGTGKISKYPLARHICECGTDRILPLEVALPFEQQEEECFILDNWSADTGAKLVAVIVVLRNTVEVVEPVTGIQCRIMVRPEHASTNLIRSGTRDHADLCRTPRCLRIDRRDDDFYFFDQIGTCISERPRSVFKSSGRHIHTISRCVHLADATDGQVSYKIVYVS